MSDKYTIHNEAALHVVTFTVVGWIAGPEVLQGVGLRNPTN
jgi:hypothetical protein